MALCTSSVSQVLSLPCVPSSTSNIFVAQLQSCQNVIAIPMGHLGARLLETPQTNAATPSTSSYMADAGIGYSSYMADAGIGYSYMADAGIGYYFTGCSFMAAPPTDARSAAGDASDVNRCEFNEDKM